MIMDKRSFNFMFTLVVASMVLIGTYKIAKKKGHAGKIIAIIDKSK